MNVANAAGSIATLEGGMELIKASLRATYSLAGIPGVSSLLAISYSRCCISSTSVDA